MMSPGLYFCVKTVHGSGSSCLRPEADSLVLRVEVENHRLHLLAHLEHLRRMLWLRPRHLADVNEALDALLELHERAVVGERDDLALDLRARRVGVGRHVPRVFHGLLEAKRHPLGVGVVLEDFDGDLVAHLEHLGRMVDAAPAHVGDVKEPVDAAEVDERTVLGDVLDRAGDDLLLPADSRGSLP